MLNFLRKRASSWAIKFIFSLIILVFVLWGVGTMREKEQNLVGQVGKTGITTAEFQNAMTLVSDGYKMAFGDRFDYKLFEEKIKSEAWDILVEQTLLLRKANELGIKVSDAEIVDEIQKQDAFKENGQFSRDRYLNVMRYMKKSPAQYEKDVERSLAMRKTMSFLKNAVTASDTDVAEFFAQKNRKIRAGYVAVSAAAHAKSVTVADDELKKEYEAAKDRFKKPESANVSYIFMPYADFSASVAVDDNAVKEYYEENKASFMQSKTYVLKHIFVAAGKDPVAARKRIEDAKKLIAKESFEKVASRVNDDGTKQRGGLLGEVRIDGVTPKLAARLQSMKKGDVSDITESEYGFHILKVDDFRDERMRSLDEVRPEVTERIKTSKSKVLAMKKANDAKAELQKQADPSVAAGAYKVVKASVEKGKPVVGDLGAMPEVVKTIFQTAEGGTFGPLSLTKGVLVGKVRGFERGYYSFDETKGRVREMLITKKALDLAAGKAEEMLKTSALKGQTTDWFSPSGALPAPLNGVKDLEKEIVALTGGRKRLNKAYRSADTAYIVYLVDEKTSVWNPVSEEGKGFREEFLNNKRALFYKAWLTGEKAGVKITQNESFFKKS